MNFPCPQPRPNTKTKYIITVKKPHETEWTVKAYEDVKPDQGLPPHPEPKGRGRR